ncbi:SGNH/GDSL hydrolase family protein [Desemzia sp. RIT804]|uniref:SGNH/GDSL hydrolase family protein n=1 Tax=Desemzia sp. RIT 804 TaxID=2810209 RepID=UPI001951AD6C|nr:SGNH/GDSL hydrolase family protein [Desemzia sp. RIT 804]MBM6614494.1 SGNH/GDSL hydrolase family protein [Desemzia sp. RIT 804]
MKLVQNDTILFYGDSITDAGRNRAESGDLGQGYPLMTAGRIQADYPDLNLTFLNRGISGDKVADLKQRLQEDCISLNPTVVSILIGINDTWHIENSTALGSAEVMVQFEQDYREVLKRIKEETEARIILMEPFVLPYPEDRANWRFDLDQRIHIIRKLAKEFHAEFVTLDGPLNAYGIKHSFQYLTGEDGVHPTVAGHGLIAKKWLEIIE